MTCVAIGTKIRLSNGEREVIENLNKPDVKLLSGTGTEVLVLSGIAGLEKVLKSIELVGGKKVATTFSHPFFNSDGKFVKASEIKVGDTLKTIDGFEKVAAVDDLLYNDTVFNLYLSSMKLEPVMFFKDKKLIASEVERLKREDPFTGLHAKDHTFYANDILLGD